jgi:hypothetical protein
MIWNLLKEKTCLIFHHNKGYFERLVILNQTKVPNWYIVDQVKIKFHIYNIYFTQFNRHLIVSIDEKEQLILVWFNITSLSKYPFSLLANLFCVFHTFLVYCSFSSIDTIKCLFNCVIYIFFIDKRLRVIDMKFYFHLVNYVSVGYLRKQKNSIFCLFSLSFNAFYTRKFDTPFPIL